MDLSLTTAPKSDQLNADDLIAGPQTFTVERVTEGNAEQPVNIHLVEMPGRPYRPSKTMRRALIIAWNKETDVYAGRRMTLYRDPEVKFGGDKVGGIKISALSHIDRRLTMKLTETRGKKAPLVIEPLPDTTPTLDVATSTDIDALRAAYKTATPDVQAQILARVDELKGGAA